MQRSVTYGWIGGLLALIMAMTGGAGCTDEQRGSAQAATRSSGSSGELVVFAAASLRNAFQELGRDFGRVHGVEVTFNFAGSQKVRTHIEHGARADVFASADRAHMDALARQGLVGPAAVFALGEPVVVVPEGATAVQAFADLADAERIIIGAAEVPIGRYTRQVLDRAEAAWPGFAARVMARVVSQELNVRQVLAKVALGEADAGVVYRSDAVAADGTAQARVDVIDIPAELAVVAEYPMAALADAPHPELAARWIEYVRSAEGRAVLARWGFAAPAGPPAGAGAGDDEAR